MRKKNMLADFLKMKRNSVGLSQKEVADQMGYSTPQFISNWERGVSHPPIGVLKKLGELYRVSAEDIFEVTLKATIEEVTVDLRKKFNRSRR